MRRKIEWTQSNNNITLNDIIKIQELFGIAFPKDYVQCVLENDGGYPSPDNFDIENYGEQVLNNFLSFDKHDDAYIIDAYNDIKDRLVKKVYPFAEDPFGNMVCFDFRCNSEPLIVFWDSEISFDSSEEAIILISKSFSEFMDSLY